MQPKEIEHSLGLSSSQLKLWLQQALAEGLITRLNRPVRYELAARRADQVSMFQDEAGT